MRQDRRQRIERRLDEIAAWRASALPLATYAAQRGQALTLWRGRLTWEGRWRQMLQCADQEAALQSQPTPAGQEPIPKVPAPTNPVAFVQAVRAPKRQPAPNRLAHPCTPSKAHWPERPMAEPSICITLSRGGGGPGGGVQACIHWPLGQIEHSSAWLRAVLT